MRGGILFVVVLVSLVCWGEAESTFQRWEKLYQRTYASGSERSDRERVFAENEAFVQQHNLSPRSYRVALNQFADLTFGEFSQLMSGIVGPPSKPVRYSQRARTPLPPSWDWRSYGVVTPVKNQGNCNSCWAFSATGAIESAKAILTGELVSLSEQNLMDCSWREGNRACGGGTPDASFGYVLRSGGIDSEQAYPYTMQSTTTCRYAKSTPAASLGNYTALPHGDEEELQMAVASKGPVSALIDGNDPGFQFYSSGIYFNPFCSKSKANHAVLVVGYGTSNATEIEYGEPVSEYWIAKNSFGPTWGDRGYIQMARNMNNSCGIASRASYPNVMAG